MTHCSDDDLVLQYYGESQGAEAHVAACAACATRARDLALLLSSIEGDVPERSERYGAEVWARVQPRLQPPSRLRIVRAWVAPAVVRWSLAAAATVALVAGGFLAGRVTSPGSQGVEPTRAETESTDPRDARRVLLLSVADHLERSDRMLTDIMNAPDVDVSAEQRWAGDLVAANRLFRQDALDADESSLAFVLEELERALLDIVHRPADADAALQDIRERIDSAALLFKVRVMSSELRERELGSDVSSPERSTTPIS